jgi:phosphatidate cytidylyltransferase
LVHFRLDYGFVWLLWMILCVVATDVSGYFVGRAVGGPKFWPRISPKKTWSGTAGGWVAAACVGLVFDLMFVVVGPEIIVLSVLVSFAGQMGDIAESAVKRRMGVKDASALIPGHGGLWDRFDALLGASLFMILMADVLGRTGLAQ